jgi:hypothetical protein
MTPSKTLSAALALGLAVLAGPALANQTSDHVYSIDLQRDGISGFVTIRNVSANKHVSAVKIEPTKSSVSLSMAGWVSCENPPAFAESLFVQNGTKMYFGTIGLGHDQVWEQQVLHEAPYLPSYAEWHRSEPLAPAKKQTYSVNQAAFVVPLAKVKNGPADLRFDPIALFNEKLQQHVNGGGDAVAFLRQDHSFSVERPISLGATCMFRFNNPNKNTNGGAWATAMVPLTVQYKGDPAINDTPVLNAQIVQGGGVANQLQAGSQPFKITTMQFQPNMPHHVGACPAKTTIRVTYMGQGKGEIRIRINEGGSTIHNSSVIAFDSKNGWQHYDFEIATPKALPHQLNKTVEHDLRVYVRGKDEKAATWPASYQPMDAAVWKHRCVPQVNPSLGGSGPSVQFKQPSPGPATPVIKRAQ